jgi:hypothetical protein
VNKLMQSFQDCSLLAGKAAQIYMPYAMGVAATKKGMDEYLDEFRVVHAEQFANRDEDFKQLFTVFFVSFVRFNKMMNRNEQ